MSLFKNIVFLCRIMASKNGVDYEIHKIAEYSTANSDLLLLILLALAMNFKL